jgi:hypothetical protein
MHKPTSVRSLEQLGRVRLSPSFFMRDFLHSEIADLHGLPNIPDNPTLAIAAGRCLCEQLLEPLQSTFGRLAIRSAYRAPAVNAFGNAHRLSCASNERNYARHIWDRRDARGCMGALTTVVIPWFADQYAEGADWRAMAWWIHDHLPYSERCSSSRSSRPSTLGGTSVQSAGSTASSFRLLSDATRDGESWGHPFPGLFLLPWPLRKARRGD